MRPDYTDPRPHLVPEAVEQYWARRPRRERWMKRLRDLRAAVRGVLIVAWQRRFG